MTVSARAGGGLDTDAGGGSAAVINTGAGKKTEKKTYLMVGIDTPNWG